MRIIGNADLQREHLEFLSEKFESAQKGFTKHNTYANEIAERFKDDTDKLVTHLKPFLQILLQQFKREPPAERSVRFIVKIVTCKKNGLDWGATMVTNLITFVIQYWNAKDKAVRFRVCEILGYLLNELDENFEIDEDLWIDMEEKLLIRLRDKIPQIRRSACVALNRLQMPDFEDDKVIPALAFVMDHDSNKDCRREALIRLDLSKDTLMKIIRRIRDISDEVRCTAFKRLCQVDIKALQIYDRVIILKTGLKDRVESVRNECSGLLIRRWLSSPSLGNDFIRFLKLIDPENYETECELILKHLLNKGAKGTHLQPPYSKEELTAEHVFYWRVLADHCRAMKDDDGLEKIMPDIKDFCLILEGFIENEFVAWQLLKLAMHLDFADEFGRSELVSLGQKIMTCTTSSTELIPFVTKVLRAVMSSEDYVRQICEIVNDIRDPLDEEEPEGDEEKRLQLENQIEELHNEKELLREEKIVAIRTEDFETAAIAKRRIEELDAQMQEIESNLNRREKRDQDTWKRVLTTVGDLLEFTRMSLKHGPGKHWLEPLLNHTLIPAVSHEDPFIREPGLLSFGLYCMLDKNIARKNLILFLNVLQNDQLALQYLSLKIMFDLFMVFDLFDEEIKITPVDDLGMEDEIQPQLPGNATKVLETMKSFLNTEDCDMLACSVEGFTKLLFLNRLPIYQIDVLSRLFLLYFNVVTEQNEHIRQCLSMFFPLYASNKTPAGAGNRKTIARCLMPCLRAVAYAPKESALTTIPINKLTEYFLWLLDADPLTNPTAQEATVEASDTLSFHEQIAFDVLFEIEANIGSSGVRNLCRVLSILNLDKRNQHNIKQYKVLLNRINSRVSDKRGAKYLEKFRATLEAKDENPNEFLNEIELEELEEKRAREVENKADQLKTWINQQDEANDLEESPVKARGGSESGRRKRQMGRRHMELVNEETGEVAFGSPDEKNKRRKIVGVDTDKKPRKKKRTKSPTTAQREVDAEQKAQDEDVQNRSVLNDPELEGLLADDDDESPPVTRPQSASAPTNVKANPQSKKSRDEDLEALLEDSD